MAKKPKTRLLVKPSECGWLVWEDLPKERQREYIKRGLSPVELDLVLPGEEDEPDINDS